MPNKSYNCTPVFQSPKKNILFQVLDFVYSDQSALFNLLPIDKLLLICLAKHKGPLGIFPSQKTLAKELKISDRFVRERLRYLETNGLIYVEKIKSKSHYVLFLDESYPQKTQKSASTTPAHRNHSSADTGTTVPTISNDLYNNIINTSFDRKLNRTVEVKSRVPWFNGNH